ncbi:MAG: hypothetical protein Udaeo2_19690 [Candidatus Udaeobacter sp.]|nr:MAG: hypothetical protein Udaeo2_19690 [Candidatus Udaeobacter sp.]
MITPRCRSLWLVQFIFGISAFLFSPSLRSAASPTPVPVRVIDEKLFKGIQWRQIGPFRGGRALTIEGVPGKPDTYYFGAVAGGVWKTIDAGTNWTPLFDKQPISSIGAIAVAPSDHNVIYAGTGEAAIRGNTTYGTGVFKSVDGGKTWENVGLKDSRQIGAVVALSGAIVWYALGHHLAQAWREYLGPPGGQTWARLPKRSGGMDGFRAQYQWPSCQARRWFFHGTGQLKSA